jgi:hypothetical protein
LLFQSYSRATGQLNGNPLPQANAYAIFSGAPKPPASPRAPGIMAYLANGGALEHAQEMASHESPRTTKLYERTKKRLTQYKVERIRL